MPKKQQITSQQSPITDHLTDELKFLIACCRVQPDPDEIHTHLLLITHHSSLITAAAQHGILPLVYKTMKTLHSSLLTPRALVPTVGRTPHSSLEQLLNELKANYQSIARRNMLMSAELIRIIQLLEKNSIEALAFKGPVLSQMAYGDITLRQYVDLDILVDEKDAFKAAEVMSQNGHTALLPLTILSNQTCLHTAKDFSLLSESGGVHTELHWRLFEKKYNISLLSCAAEGKCQSVKISGHSIKTLQNELLMVYLCLHGAKHAFERIEWICDIDRLVRHTQIDWEEAVLLAQRSQATRAFYLAFSLSQHLLHTVLPEEIIRGTESDTIRELQRLTLKKMSEKRGERGGLEKNRETFFYQAKLFDRKRDMLRFWLSTFFRVSTTDCQTFILPEKLKFLYIILRPLRLAGTYLGRLFTR